MTQTDTKSFTLSSEIMQKLQAQVSFENDAALNQFLADAINSYMQLGQLHQSGGRFVFEAEGRDEPIVLHFPFEQA